MIAEKKKQAQRMKWRREEQAKRKTAQYIANKHYIPASAVTIRGDQGYTISTQGRVVNRGKNGRVRRVAMPLANLDITRESFGEAPPQYSRPDASAAAPSLLPSPEPTSQRSPKAKRLCRRTVVMSSPQQHLPIWQMATVNPERSHRQARISLGDQTPVLAVRRRSDIGRREHRESRLVSLGYLLLAGKSSFVLSRLGERRQQHISSDFKLTLVVIGSLSHNQSTNLF